VSILSAFPSSSPEPIPPTAADNTVSLLEEEVLSKREDSAAIHSQSRRWQLEEGKFILIRVRRSNEINMYIYSHGISFSRCIVALNPSPELWLHVRTEIHLPLMQAL
jgi:hypothetical protein